MTSTVQDTERAWWRPGDPAGTRRFENLGDLALERGGVLPDVVVAYETWGTLAPSGNNAILVEHALTGDSHVVGEAGLGHPSPGWWPSMVGPGAPLDTDRFYVVASNVLGGCQGSTGPSSLAPDGRPWAGRFPFVTIRDQVAAEAVLADALGIARWHAVLGGSMGGMRALEWAATYPHRVDRTVALASSGYATADQIAWCRPQVLAIRTDSRYRDGNYYGEEPPSAGLGIARRIAQATYRTERELDDRFGRRPRVGEDPLGAGGRYDVESYLDHHAGKLAQRFDANSYVVLTEAMNSHDLGRGRGGWRSAVSSFDGQLHLAAVSSDRLFPPRLSQELADTRPGSTMHVIDSAHGHDGFLLEVDQVGTLLREVLEPGRHSPLR
ncbi:MAG: homoserine O-acetyltransferase MetX [Dermatophilaceae bacterium]